MRKNEKFEEFIEALREVNKRSLAEEGEERIFPSTVEILIGELEYYLENQEEIKAELQVPLDAYRKLNEVDCDDDVEWERVDYEYGTHHLSDEVLKEIKIVGGYLYFLCYTYNGYDLTFGIWDEQNSKGFIELVRIAVNTDLQFENEKDFRDLVEKVADALKKW